MNYDTFKFIAVSCGGWLWSACGPSLPYATVCTAMVIADVISARRLARRLRNIAPEQRENLKFNSARFSKVIMTLLKIYGVLLLAAMLQYVIIRDWCDLLKVVAATICFWQGVSILENESSSNGSKWAKILRRVLIDKTERHLGVSLDELRDNEK